MKTFFTSKLKLQYIFLIFLEIFLLFSCRDNPAAYYIVDKIRVPAAQIYSQTSHTGQGCVAGLFDASIWCQQFPVRPFGTINAASAGKIKLRFLSLAPQGIPVTLTLTSLKVFDLSLLNGSAGNGARGADSNLRSIEIPLSDFNFNLNSSLSSTLRTSPMQIQTVVYDFEPPTLNSLISYANRFNFFPGFQLFYTASSITQRYSDSGYINFFVLPDAVDITSWAALSSGLLNIASSTTLAQVYSLSTLNVPIQIKSITPVSSSTIKAQSNNNFLVDLTYNPNPNSYSPAQWYVSSGTVGNDRSASTIWNPMQSGDVTAVFVVRDLLGGVDYQVNNFNAQ